MMTPDELLVIARRHYTAQRRLKRARGRAVERYVTTVKPMALMWARVEEAITDEADEADEAMAQWMVIKHTAFNTADDGDQEPTEPTED